MQEFDFIRPNSLDELVDVLDEGGGKILAGGTDIIPRIRHDLFPASVLVDASNLSELSFIEEVDNQIAIGALTTHQAIVNSALLQNANPALVAAAESVGCIQTRHRGTLGGNIANASPAGDTIPPLLAFDAQVHLVCKGGERSVPLKEFLVGPGKTSLEAEELIHSITFSRLQGAWGTAFQKMGKRKGMAIAVVSVAAAVVLDASGLVQDARIALGSVAPTVVRSPKAEKMLLGTEVGSGAIREAANAVVEDISPIRDVRSTAEYRRHAAQVLTHRALEEAVDGAKGRLS
jgi:carbon-monoxide dehydrogenase medium subunit